jgi:hypothetical protein
MAFVTPCEDFMGIDPHFDLWNHFFHIRCPQDPGTKMIVLEGVVIDVMPGHGMDAYLGMPMPRSLNGW